MIVMLCVCNADTTCVCVCVCPCECTGGVLSAEVNLQAETALIRVRKATAKKGTGDELANALTQSGVDSSCRNMSDGNTKARRPYDVTEVMREKQQERYACIHTCCYGCVCFGSRSPVKRR